MLEVEEGQFGSPSGEPSAPTIKNALLIDSFPNGIFLFSSRPARRSKPPGSDASGTPSTPNVTLPGPQNPFLGSSPEGQATPDVLQIDFKDAIDRGLRNNLGLLLAGDQAQTARGGRWKELSQLLPNVSAHVIENAQNAESRSSWVSINSCRC